MDIETYDTLDKKTYTNKQHKGDTTMNQEYNNQDIRLTIVDDLLEQNTLPNAKLLAQYNKLSKEIKQLKRVLETKIKSYQKVKEQIYGKNSSKVH